MARQQGITLAIVLDHVKGLASGVHGLQRDMHKLEKEMKLMEGRLQKEMSTGFTMISTRIKTLEWEDLPRRVSRLEDKVFAGIDE